MNGHAGEQSNQSYHNFHLHFLHLSINGKLESNATDNLKKESEGFHESFNMKGSETMSFMIPFRAKCPAKL